MAVLVEGISVVVPVSAIERSYAGGLERYLRSAPNQTMCCDGELTRVGFMSSADAQRFVDALIAAGLQFRSITEVIDIAVVDQLRGPVIPCQWLAFGHVQGPIARIAVARLVSGVTQEIALPTGWAYDRSLSQSCGFVPGSESELESSGLVLVRSQEDGIDVYHNSLTGEEVFVGRS